MKKLLTLLLALTLLVSAWTLTACMGGEEEDDTVVRMGVMTGPTGIGAAKLMNDAKTEGGYEFTVKGNAKELSPLLLTGELDVAAIPSNVAATLYNNSDGKILLAAINTLSVVSILERGEAITSLEDLRGKTIYATGKGGVPEYTVRYLLEQAGLDPDEDVTFEWRTEPQEVLQFLKSDAGVGGVAMMPQPFVTKALSAVQGLRIALDLNDEWEKVEDDSRPVTGVLVVRAEFAEKHPERLAELLDDYKASIEYANAHTDEVAPMIEEHVGIEAGIVKRALPACNIAFYSGDEMKTVLAPFLEALYDMQPASIGGKLPTDAFYYGADGK